MIIVASPKPAWHKFFHSTLIKKLIKMENSRIGLATISIHAPISKVWEALTTPELIKKYFFGTNAVSDWKAGSPIIFKGEWEGKSYEDKGTILNMIPQRLFRYNYWSSMSGQEDTAENYVNITYELFEDNKKTILVITQENIPDQQTKEYSEQNWKKILGDMKKTLEKKADKVMMEENV
jgi:uncharacterized protein YndB with AHSA1/START domain